MAQAQEPELRLAIGAFRVQGLEAETVARTHALIEEQLRSGGATLVAEVGELETGCLQVSACLRTAMEPYGVAGVVDTQIIRFGPVVRVNVRFYDVRSGVSAHEVATTAPAEGFPESADLAADLARGLDALRKLQPVPAEPTAAASQPVSSPAVVAATPVEASSTLEKQTDAHSDVEAPAQIGAAGAPAAQPARKLPLALMGWIAAGLGGGLLAGGAVTGSLAMAVDQQLYSSCGPTLECSADQADNVAQLQRLAATTDVLLVAGVLAAAAGASLLVVSWLGEDDSATAATPQPAGSGGGAAGGGGGGP